jgi:hypothetical protein
MNKNLDKEEQNFSHRGTNHEFRVRLIGTNHRINHEFGVRLIEMKF